MVSATLAARRQRLLREQAPASGLLAGLATMAQRPPLLAILDRGTADRFGGTTRGDSLNKRKAPHSEISATAAGAGVFMAGSAAGWSASGEGVGVVSACMAWIFSQDR